MRSQELEAAIREALAAAESEDFDGATMRLALAFARAAQLRESRPRAFDIPVPSEPHTTRLAQIRRQQRR
jgi:hypothetical protein